MENPITIVGVKVDRFLRLTAARLEVGPDGGLIRVTGPNKAGKTSLLRSIRAALGGGKEVPDDPLHDDSETGTITLKLSNGFTVERRFTNTESGLKGYLKVVGPDGEEMKQTALNDWLGPRSFDPLHFFSLAAKEQREVLLGLDESVAEDLATIEKKTEDLRSERLPHNSLIQKVQRMDAPDGIRPEKVDVTAEMERLVELEDQQRTHDEAVGEFTKASDRLKACAGDIESVEEEHGRLVTLSKEIERTRDKFREQVAEHRPVTADIDQLKEKIAGADQVNEQLAPWEEHDRAQTELKEAADAAKKLTDRIEELDRKKVFLLGELAVGVEGLGFDEEGNPTLNGHPMEQTSGRERVEVAVAVAMAYDPKLRICLVDEANDLDADGLKELDAKAREHGFQVWACRIDEGDPGEVVVDDGQAWTEGQQ